MIAGILLAAGASRRFGSRKLLHPLPDGTPIVLRSARNLLSGVDNAVVVVPPGDNDIPRLLAAERFAVHVCAESAEGMGASLACGVRASPDADGWVIMLADLPFVRPTTITAVATALREGAPIAAPFYGGRRGHPVGFGRRYHAQLAALSGDVGAREILSANQIAPVPVDDPGIHRDIDTPDDLNR